jgi:hypothetical protein
VVVGLRRTLRGLLIIGLALALPVTACSDSSTSPADAPEGHTVFRGDAAHAPGLNNPTVNCTQCHGADLRGGDAGEPSCFSCHGKKW